MQFCLPCICSSQFKKKQLYETLGEQLNTLNVFGAVRGFALNCSSATVGENIFRRCAPKKVSFKRLAPAQEKAPFFLPPWCLETGPHYISLAGMELERSPVSAS